MAKKTVDTKGYVKMKSKKRRKRKLVKFIFAYSAVRATVKVAGRLIDRYNEEDEVVEAGDVVNYSLAFKGRNIKVENEPFNGAIVNAICSGLKLDLSNAIIEDDVNIYCKNTMSGISIIVPENVKVEVSSKTKFSGVANNVPVIDDDAAPTIHIHVDNYMSGVDVKVKQESSIKDFINKKVRVSKEEIESEEDYETEEDEAAEDNEIEDNETEDDGAKDKE